MIHRHDYLEFVVIRRLGDGVVVVRRHDRLTGESDQAVWSLVKTRKDARCAATGREIPKGSQAWRPVGNQQYRYERIAEGVLS